MPVTKSMRVFKYISCYSLSAMASTMGIDLDVLEQQLRLHDIIVDRQQGRMRTLKSTY